MKKLIVLYDSEVKDAGRDSYLRAIQKQIPSDKLLLMDLDKQNNIFIDGNNDRVILLEPASDEAHKQLKEFFNIHKHLDIEGKYTGKLTITAEAIIKTLDDRYRDIARLKVLIVNKSDTIGKPLYKELKARGLKALILDSKADVKKSLQHFKPDVVVTATGNKDFNIPGHLLADAEMVIDLSNDTNLNRAIRRIPTAKVLRDRLDKED